MKILKYSIKNFLYRPKTSSSVVATIFVISLSIMACSVILGVCDIYKSKNENPYSGYYRLLIDRNAIYDNAEEGVVFFDMGYETIDQMYCGDWKKVQQIHKYFLNITDYTVELAYHTTANIKPIIPLGINDSGYFLLYGITDSKEISSFFRGELTLVEGRYLTSKDRVQNNSVCMISEDIARVNSLSLGDNIEINMKNNSRKTFSIVGIYRDNVIRDTTTLSLSYQFESNRIYIPLSSLEFDDVYGYTCYNYQILLDDNKYVDEIETLVNTYSMCEGFPAYFIRVSDLYETNNRGVHALMDAFEVAEYVFILISAFIIFIFISSVIRSREYEIGICISLGYSKVAVVIMLFVELTISAIIGVVLSAITWCVFGDEIATVLLCQAINISSAENVENTSSESLLLSVFETESINAMIDYSFIFESIKASLWFIVGVIVIGYVVTVVKIIRINVMELLTRRKEG